MSDPIIERAGEVMNDEQADFETYCIAKQDAKNEAVAIVQAMLEKSKTDLENWKNWSGPTVGTEKLEMRILVYEDVIAALSTPHTPTGE